jgi:hypothetical protein
MKSWVFVVVAVACGGKPPLDPGPASGSNTPPTMTADAVVVVTPNIPAIPIPPPAYPIEAPPGGKIVRFAVTPAADAAITLDDANEMRLWPTLDGKQPPVAIELPPATSFALQRSGREYVALLGLIGGAVHVRLDVTGKRRGVIELGEIDGVAAIDAGFVTWRGKHIEWIDLAGKVTRTSDTEARPVSPPSSVTAKNSDLVIASPDGPRYLGYAFPLLGAPNGSDRRHLVVPGPDNRFLQVTADLTVVGELAPWTPKGEVATAMHWLGDRDWLVDVPSGVVLWIEGAPTGTLVVPKASVSQVEVESHLVLLSGKTKQLARHVPSKHALELVKFTGWSGEAGAEHLVTPSKNRGALMVITGFERDTDGVAHGTARWIHDLDRPEQGVVDWRGVEVWPMTTTSSGAVIVNAQSRHWALLIDGVMEPDMSPNVAVSGDGTRLVQTTPGATIELSKRAGGIVWTIPSPAKKPLWHTNVWFADDDLVWIVQSHGVAALAAATGALVRAATGWGFELSRTPHSTSTTGRPLAVELATDRDPPYALAGDARFQTLAREVAEQSKTQVLWWGPVKVDGGVHRVAFLQSPQDDGTPLFAFLVETKPDAVVAITASMWGFPDFQGVFPGQDPTWGTIAMPDDSAVLPTLDAAPFKVGAKWIHMSYERVQFTLERGTFVAIGNDWLERENTGNPERRFKETNGGRQYPAGRRPKLATFKGHATRFAVSAPSYSAAALASGIYELPEPK